MKTLQLTLLAILFSGCGSLPQKPIVELCTIDLPRQQLVCSSSAAVSGVEALRYRSLAAIISNATTSKIPLIQADKFICFSPTDWEKVAVYSKTLRDAAEQRCH